MKFYTKFATWICQYINALFVIRSYIDVLHRLSASMYQLALFRFFFFLSFSVMVYFWCISCGSGFDKATEPSV